MPVMAGESRFAGWQGVGRRFELIWLLTRDALRKQFAGSLLGLWWAILKPVLLVSVYAFLVLSVFRPSAGAGSNPADYILILMSGMAPWLLLAEPLAAASVSLATNTPLLTKVLFPIEVLPVSRVLAAVVSGGTALLLLVVFLGMQGRLGLWAVVVPVAVMLQVLFVLGLGWLIAAVAVTLPDVIHALPFLLNLWMLLSPVLYSPEMVPSGLGWLGIVNPMWPTIAVYRSLLLDNAAPDPAHLAIMGGWAAASFLIGYVIFMKRRTMFADVI